MYAGLPGPHYETPAEIVMLRTLGADLVGMSTVLETIAARHLGLEVLAVSLVTNLAAGLADQGLDHGEVASRPGPGRQAGWERCSPASSRRSHPREPHRPGPARVSVVHRP